MGSERCGCDSLMGSSRGSLQRLYVQQSTKPLRRRSCWTLSHSQATYHQSSIRPPRLGYAVPCVRLLSCAVPLTSRVGRGMQHTSVSSGYQGLDVSIPSCTRCGRSWSVRALLHVMLCRLLARLLQCLPRQTVLRGGVHFTLRRRLVTGGVQHGVCPRRVSPVQLPHR